MKKAQLRKLLAANQFIMEESLNKLGEKKSWFTVPVRLSVVYP
jgi:hypothetical protein